MNNHFRTYYPSPLGLIQINAGERGLLSLTFPPNGVSQPEPPNEIESSENTDDAPFSRIVRELEAYFSGELRQFSIEIDWNLFSGFKKDVLALTATIPFGEVRTYGDLARELGKPGAARAVGKALGSNPLLILIPCHRVIGSTKRLHGYAGGLDAKAFLLTLEGLQIVGDRVVGVG